MEYIKLTHNEEILGKKILLTSQVNFLKSQKRIKEYQKLRNEEIATKIVLRRKIAEALDELKILKKILPKEEGELKIPVKKTSQKRRQDLELEIEEIRRKIERLQ